MSDAAALQRKMRCRLISDGDLDAVATLLAHGFPRRTVNYFRKGLNASPPAIRRKACHAMAMPWKRKVQLSVRYC